MPEVNAPDCYSSTADHLQDELMWLDLILRLGLARAKARRTDESGLFISDRTAEALLAEPRSRDMYSHEEAELLRCIDDTREAIAGRVSASIEQGIGLHLPRIASLFGLSPFEVDTLIVCLAPELDTKYGQLYAYLQDDATRHLPSVDLILTLLCRNSEERATARSAFHSSGRLIRYSLLQMVDSSATSRSLLARSVKLDEGVVHHLLGGKAVDSRIAAGCRVILPEATGQPAHDDLVLREPFKRYLEHPSSRQWIALFSGQDRHRQEATARALCAEAGLPLLRVNVGLFLRGEVSPAEAIPLVFRDAAMKSAAVYIENADLLVGESETQPSHIHILEKSMEELGWITFLAGKHAPELNDQLKRQQLFHLEFLLPSYPERLRLWHDAVEHGMTAEGTLKLDSLAARFRFTGNETRNAIARARTAAALRNGETAAVTQADLESACRAESHSRLSRYAKKVDHTYSWDDLVLPAAQKSQLAEIIDYVRNYEAVYGGWGFNRKHTLGKGVNILFSGPSGTGKTMAAGIIASALSLDCYKVDLSTVVSKYIGETEKNLSRIFDEGVTSNAVLFFDEADALFGKRTEVKDSHDRYANIEVNYLLQKMEEYDGVVILATNLSKNVDDAFLRRVHFSVVFPVPEREERLQVWRHVFPREAPLGEDLDWDFLARRLKMTGGNIKNVAVGAAFLAKGEDSEITMRHVVLAVKREFQKMGKLTTKAEFGDYYDITA